jgi:hypothetical protein
MGTIDDLNSTGKNAVLNIGALASAITTPTSLNSTIISAANIIAGALGTVATFGTFTLSAATTTVVAQAAVVATSVVVLTPTNAAAALAIRTNGIYVSAYTATTSFSVSTQSNSAAGTETFQYVLFK